MKSNLFYLFLAILILCGSLLLIPKVSTKLFPFIQRKYLTSFLESTKKRKSIDSREFWILREYYSPGNFVFKEKGLNNQESSEMTKTLHLTLKKNIYVYPFITFNSKKFKSLEALTKETSISAVIRDFDEYPRKDCIIRQQDQYICKTDDSTITVIFIKPMKEMRITNGFFDYKRKDLDELTKDKNWLVVSDIAL